MVIAVSGGNDSLVVAAAYLEAAVLLKEKAPQLVFVHFRTSALLDEARNRASKTNPNAASLGKTMERDTGNVEHLKETLREFSEAGVLNLIIDDFGGQNYDEIW